jgi:hypothetical protein
MKKQMKAIDLHGRMPARSALTIHGRFPHARYFKFNLYKFERNTFVAIPGAAFAGMTSSPIRGRPIRTRSGPTARSRTATSPCRFWPKTRQRTPRIDRRTRSTPARTHGRFRLASASTFPTRGMTAQQIEHLGREHDVAVLAALRGLGARGDAVIRRTRGHLRGQARRRNSALRPGSRQTIGSADGLGAAAVDCR